MKHLPKTDELITQLQQIETFQDIDAAALQWLVDRSTYYTQEEGEFLFQPGEAANEMLILMKGRYVVYLDQNGKRREVGVFHDGYITGTLPFSRMKEVSATAVVLEECIILSLNKKHFVEMVNVSYELTEALVAFMSSRIRDFSQLRYQDEKLMSLGKLSAGLAHELNNPASAMVRSSEELYKNVHATPERFKSIITMKITPADTDRVNAILFSKIKNLNQISLSILEREEHMDDLLDWLEDHEIEQGDDIAETFLDFGLEVEELEQVAEIVEKEALPSILWWIESTLSMEKLVTEIRESADRIAELVRAVKGYSYMDRGTSMEEIDLREGLNQTLMILKHKIKDRQIQVSQEFAPDLPKVHAFGGELNQIWTNLISNAVEAMEPGGILTLRAYAARGKVWVEVQDNGTGISEEIQYRIFDPFFTTKPMGEGTGMGLDITKKIIKRHEGDISVRSKPGETVFEVWLPLQQEK